MSSAAAVSQTQLLSKTRAPSKSAKASRPHKILKVGPGRKPTSNGRLRGLSADEFIRQFNLKPPFNVEVILSRPKKRQPKVTLSANQNI